MEERRIEIICFVAHFDERGQLIATDKCLPFHVKNIFWIYGNEKQRGGHAHKKTAQILIAISGTVAVFIDDIEYVLSSPWHGVYIPPMHKVRMIFDPGAILLVLASERYDPDDYIQ